MKQPSNNIINQNPIEFRCFEMFAFYKMSYWTYEFGLCPRWSKQNPHEQPVFWLSKLFSLMHCLLHCAQFNPQDCSTGQVDGRLPALGLLRSLRPVLLSSVDIWYQTARYNKPIHTSRSGSVKPHNKLFTTKYYTYKWTLKCPSSTYLSRAVPRCRLLASERGR